MSRPQVYGKKIIDVPIGDVSSLTSVTGIFDMSEANHCMIRTKWTGKVTGTFTFYEMAHTDSGWELNNTPVFKQPAGAAGGDTIEMYNMNAMQYNVRYTATSGNTGPFEVWVMVKGIGG